MVLISANNRKQAASKKGILSDSRVYKRRIATGTNIKTERNVVKYIIGFPQSLLSQESMDITIVGMARLNEKRRGIFPSCETTLMARNIQLICKMKELLRKEMKLYGVPCNPNPIRASESNNL